MKIPLIALSVVVPLCFSACGKKSARITSSNPSPNPTEVADRADNSIVSPSSLADESQQEQATPSPSPSASVAARPVFKSEAATQAANQYLNSYDKVRKDVTAVPGMRPAPVTDPQAAMETFKSQLQRLGRDATELENQQTRINNLLTPEEKKRLRDYQKSLEQTARDPN